MAETEGEIEIEHSQSRRRKMKWKEQMNIDLLECKIKAKQLVETENPPRNEKRDMG